MKFATYCCLLVALAGTTALAQIHPKRKHGRKHAVVRRRVLAHVSRVAIETVPTYPEERSNCGGIKIEETVVDFDSTYIYTYVEQMPIVHGQHAQPASAAAIMQSLVVPADAPNGRVFVQFVITREGRVSHPHLLKGLRADLDSAVVTVCATTPALYAWQAKRAQGGGEYRARRYYPSKEAALG